MKKINWHCCGALDNVLDNDYMYELPDAYLDGVGKMDTITSLLEVLHESYE